MGLASSIAERIRGHNCERLVQYTKQEVAFKGLSGEGGGYKISLGNFSNNVKVTNTVTEVMKALDNNQFLLCTQAHDRIASPEFRDKCLQARVMCTIGLTNFQALIALQEPNEPLNPEIRKWIKNMNALVLNSMESFVPLRSKDMDRKVSMDYARKSGKKEQKGKRDQREFVLYESTPEIKIEDNVSAIPKKKAATRKAAIKQITISQIMKYQGIDADDMNKAISILKVP